MKVDIEKIASLASLHLEEKEKEKLGEQFQGMMEYFKVIDEIDLPDEPLRNDPNIVVSQDDQVVASEVSPESFSPYVENHHFKVPAVFQDQD